MSIKITGDIRDGLRQLTIISKGAAIEQSSRSGDRVRKNARKHLRISKTIWSQSYDKDGKRRLTRHSTNKSLGKRIAHRNKGGIDNPQNMESFITSFTMESTGTTVVGGGHKSFTPNTYRDGKIVGTERRAGAIGKRTLAILQKLNTGEINEDLVWRTKNGGYSDKSIEAFKGKWKKGRNFMQKGFADSQSYIRNSLTVQLAKTIGKRANSMKTKKETHVA